MCKMKKRNASPEKSTSQKENRSGIKSRIRTTTTAAALLAAVGCDNIPNDEIRLNPEDNSARFNIEYQYSLWSAWYDIVDYDITIRKEWDTYMWLINEKNGWHRNKTEFESDNVDDVFNEISNALDNNQIKEETTRNKNKKVNFVKKEYEDKILNTDNSSQIWEIKIKYKSE